MAPSTFNPKSEVSFFQGLLSSKEEGPNHRIALSVCPLFNQPFYQSMQLGLNGKYQDRLALKTPTFFVKLKPPGIAELC